MGIFLEMINSQVLHPSSKRDINIQYTCSVGVCFIHSLTHRLMSVNDISAAVITWKQALFQLSLCLPKEAGIMKLAERERAPSQLL